MTERRGVTERRRHDGPARLAVVALVTCCTIKGVVIAGVAGVSLGAAATNAWVIAVTLALLAVGASMVVRRRSRPPRSCGAPDGVGKVGSFTPDHAGVDPSSTSRTVSPGR